MIGDFAGTTMASGSAVSRAIGVVWSRLTGDLLVRMAPTMTKPFTRSWLGSPLALTNCARPTVPPAPGTFVTCTFLALPEAVRACCMERAVWSQPPPGAAGAMILSSIWAVAPVARPAVIAPARSARARALGKNDIWCSSVVGPARLVVGRLWR